MMLFSVAGRRGGFSLLEVMLAVAVFAGSIVAVIGLLTPVLQANRHLQDTTVAVRVIDRIAGEIDRVGFGALWEELVDKGQSVRVYATADGTRAREASSNALLSSQNPEKISDQEAYFVARLVLVDFPPVPEDQNAFGYRSYLPIRIEVFWPFPLLGSEGTPEGITVEGKSVIAFHKTLRP